MSPFIATQGENDMSTTDNTYDWQEMVSIMIHAREAIRTTDGMLRRAWHLSDDEDEMEAISIKRDAWGTCPSHE